MAPHRCGACTTLHRMQQARLCMAERCRHGPVIGCLSAALCTSPHVQIRAACAPYRSSPGPPHRGPAQCLRGADRHVHTLPAWGHTPGEPKHGVDPRTRGMPRRAVWSPKQRRLLDTLLATHFRNFKKLLSICQDVVL